MSLTTAESARLKKALRQIMREHHKTYQDLSEYLQVSLATVKRILTHEELGLTRLLTICEWLGISLSDLDSYAHRDERAQKVEFTEEQELFLANDPRFLVYLEYLQDGFSPRDIAQRFGLTAKSTDKYLLRLEQLGLIKVTGKGHVRTAHRQRPAWRPNGLLVRSHYERLMNAYHRFFIERMKRKLDQGRDPSNITVLNLAMRRDTYEKLTEELTKTIKRFSDISAFEQKFEPTDELGRMSLSVNFAFSVATDESLKALEHVFGNLTNLVADPPLE